MSVLLRPGARGFAAAGLLLVIGVYAIDAGHGFVKDDFQWIASSRLASFGDLSRLLGSPTGFFRPVISLSFAADYALFGLEPRGYGLTNLLLLVACIGSVMTLAGALGLGRETAIGAALVWALNFQGINMSVLWISGRTALVLTLLTTVAAAAWIRQRRALGAVLAMAAMWSKEEAFVLPAILTAWAWVDGKGRPQALIRTWPLWLVAGITLVFRASSGAYTPGAAPDFYTYRFDVMTLLTNGMAYADRAATTPVAALLVFLMALIVGSGRFLRGAKLENVRGVVFKGAIWIALSLAPTILLPVRSSLYALMPAVGVVIVAGAIAERFARPLSATTIERGALALLSVFIALVPVYRIRNARHVNEARLSAAIVNELSAIAAEHPEGGLVVIRDVRDARPTAEQALGPLADRAAELATGGTLHAWIDPAPQELASVAPPDLRGAIATLIVRSGNVRHQ